MMTIDWPALVRLCTTVPLPRLLHACDELVASVHNLDLWLWDHQRLELASVATGASIATEHDGAADRLPGDVCLPLRFQGEELGMFTANCSTEQSEELADLATMFSTVVRAGESTTDTINVRRRRREMSLPAEMQWALLPPTQFSLPGAEISAAVEPAYDTGGDVFDYALNGSTLSMAVLDARGHGLRAATTATVATNAMRRARRSGASLLDIASEVSTSVTTIGDDADFVSGVLLELDINTWEGNWMSAGHLPPLVLDDQVSSLQLQPALPLGMVIGGLTSEPVIQSFSLEPGQALTLYSDGMIENIALDVGDMLGDQRFQQILHDHVGSTLTSAGRTKHAARAVVNDLLQLTGTVLRDDATLMILNRPGA